MRNSLAFASSSAAFWVAVRLSGTASAVASSSAAFWQAVRLSETATAVFSPFRFFGAGSACAAEAPPRFLLLPALATIFEACALPLVLSVGAMSADTEKVMRSGVVGLSLVGKLWQLCSSTTNCDKTWFGWRWEATTRSAGRGLYRCLDSWGQKAQQQSFAQAACFDARA